MTEEVSQVEPVVVTPVVTGEDSSQVKPVAVMPVVVRGIAIGGGMPKIVVPLTGASAAELRAQAGALPRACVDIVEWRADFFEALADTASVVACAQALADQLAGTPVLFTCRTAAQGGQAAIGDEAYGDLNVAVARSGAADLIDVEYQRQAAVVGRVIGAAHASGVRVIASSHDFAGTPARDEIVARLVAMQRLGADICKIATMPHSPADVLTLLDATRIMTGEHADRPLITMAMGALGVVSRLSGETFGSAATFGMAGTPSAPGQIPAEDLHAVLTVLHRALSG